MASSQIKSIKTKMDGVFESIEQERNIFISGVSVDPIDVTNAGKFILPAGTPLAPVPASGFYKPIRRTKATAAVNNDVSVTVANAKPFAAGDVIMFYASLAATATVATISAVDTATNVITLSANHTIADAEYVEVAENGARGGRTGTAANPTQIPDPVILKVPVEVAYADGTTFDTPAVGVFRGSIKRGKVNGPGTAAFDTILKSQMPEITFLPVAAGTA